MQRSLLLVLTVLLVGAILLVVYSSAVPRSVPSSVMEDDAVFATSTTSSPTSSTIEQVAAIRLPLTQAESRITKKTFGLWVTPQTSPVSPERFRGYHTGIDFETTDEERDAEVPVQAICTGPLLQKRTATGYGGFAVQSCVMQDETVTVVYGHLKLTSVTTTIGSVRTAGETLGVLGKGYSSETDRERKHLHLSIHKGKEVDIRGYVATKAALIDWLDPQGLLFP